jgi:hypothetical protein
MRTTTLGSTALLALLLTTGAGCSVGDVNVLVTDGGGGRSGSSPFGSGGGQGGSFFGAGGNGQGGSGQSGGGPGGNGQGGNGQGGSAQGGNGQGGSSQGGAAGSAASSGSGNAGGVSGSAGTDGSAGAGGIVYVGDAGDESCGATRAGTEARQVNILLVIDKSGSMADTPTGFATDKWTAMKTALGAALDPVKGAIAFGLELYPYNSSAAIPLNCSQGGAANCCQMTTGAAAISIPIENGTTALPKILSTLGSLSPGGGTPTAATLKEALWYFTAGAGAGLAGDKYVLLATDGAPNCNATLACDAAHCTANIDAVAAGTTACSGQNCCASGAGANLACLDDPASITQITALKTAGVSTFVIGIPGTENYVNVLDAFAAAGGQTASATSPKYYAVSASGGVAALTDVFKAITVKLVTTCDLQLAKEPDDPTLLNVTIGGALIGKAGGAAGVNGWTLDRSTIPSTIRITGAPCDALKSMGATSVQVLYGCPYVGVN